MDDSCAVCAESLEWLAYGACGHKDVCSTCVVRLRFICDDRRCCICKTESGVVFVTKALGDYTKTISDMSLFPSEVKEGRVGQYWYHEDTQAFFDDLDHYKMIKAMCRLSCSVCDRMEDLPNVGSRRRANIKNVEQLKGHLFHQHKLVMCSLCLEGRKVFICEQKLYTRKELSQHISTGDSQVDGTESERGGFMGHPSCEFCLSPFYGDNELYTHMSTEHYTCHMCQRLHPGKYEYYKDYNDLEVHFRHDHFLCEEEGCLAKKFIVFQSETELKRHNTMEHGGKMSRSKRNAALQIPTSFRYSRTNEQDNRRRRGLTFRRDLMDNELSLAIQASRETATASSTTQSVTDHRRTTDVQTLTPRFESLTTSESEQPSLNLRSFPPPPQVAPGNIQQISQPNALPKKSMAAHLHQQNNPKAKASTSAPSWPAASQTPTKPAFTPSRGLNDWPSVNGVSGSSSSSRPRAEIGTSSNYPLSAPSRLPPVADFMLVSSKSSKSKSQINHSSSGPSQTPTKPVFTPSRGSNDWPSINGVSGSSSSSGPRTEIGTSLYPFSAQSHLPSTDFILISSKSSKSKSQINHSSSAPNLCEQGSLNTDFPPVQATQAPKLPAIEKPVAKVKDIRTANKSLVDRMRIALGFDEDKFTAFKEVSGKYRQGSIDAETYLANVEQFGLSHLVIEMAKLLPNAQKQKELIETYNFNVAYSAPRENSRSNGIHVINSNGSKKNKGKSIDSGRNSFAGDMISQVKELQSSMRASEEGVEVLSKDGYRADKGKSKVEVKGQIESSSSTDGGASHSIGTCNGKGKQRKKTSKFHRLRLGEDSCEAVLDLKNTDPDPDPGPNPKETNNPLQSLPARSVWKNGGGQKLFPVASRVNKNR